MQGVTAFGGSRVRRYARGILGLNASYALCLYRAIRDYWLGQLFPLRPIVLQFPITDVCNSHCIMCNVWQRKRDREFDIDELRSILADSLFREIRYVGISGGEPTLRHDLADIGQVLVDSLPKLVGASIITNAVRPKQVLERVFALAQVFDENHIQFSVSVSLDGLGVTHDEQRGVKGNYHAATEVIQALRRHGVPVSVGCTLTPLNCYEADDVLLWCIENGIEQWEFRLAVDVKRCYNEGFTKANPFTREQRFHLSLFFDKLAHDPRVTGSHRRVYRSLADQLALGAKRTAGCDWKARGVTLDARGDISYCSTRSPILGSALQTSAWQLYKRSISTRRWILQTFCNDCQHLAGQPPAKEVAREWFQACTTQLKHVSGLRPKNTGGRFRASKTVYPAEKNSLSQWREVLITGWYGTETAGDKAILGELLHLLSRYSPGCRVTLTTLDHAVTRQTQLELDGLPSANIVPMEKAYHPSLIETVDAVIIGGGPLMEINQMEYIRRTFAEANRQRKARIIFGCGVGPLYSDRLHRITGEICRLATAGFLRDQESREYASALGGSTSLAYACDPSLAYLQRWAARVRPDTEVADRPLLAGLLRANTNEYIQTTDTSQLQELNTARAQLIARAVEDFVKGCSASVSLLAMHALNTGGDDRIFNRGVASFLNDASTVCVERRYLPLSDLLEYLSKADIALAMRYHGHLFCMALGIPFLSIDYTGDGGKVRNLVERIGCSQWVEDWQFIDVRRTSSKLRELYEDRLHWSVHLKTETHKLVCQLNEVYAKVFEL